MHQGLLDRDAALDVPCERRERARRRVHAPGGAYLPRGMPMCSSESFRGTPPEDALQLIQVTCHTRLPRVSNCWMVVGVWFGMRGVVRSKPYTSAAARSKKITLLIHPQDFYTHLLPEGNKKAWPAAAVQYIPITVEEPVEENRSNEKLWHTIG